jgi:hypothetical protein
VNLSPNKSLCPCLGSIWKMQHLSMATTTKTEAQAQAQGLNEQ